LIWWARAVSAGRAEAIAEATTHALDLIRKARDACRAAADAASDPVRLRNDDGFRRDWRSRMLGIGADPVVAGEGAQCGLNGDLSSEVDITPLNDDGAMN
jgi:hypothetical protein